MYRIPESFDNHLSLKRLLILRANCQATGSTSWPSQIITGSKRQSEQPALSEKTIAKANQQACKTSKKKKNAKPRKYLKQKATIGPGYKVYKIKARRPDSKSKAYERRIFTKL